MPGSPEHVPVIAVASGKGGVGQPVMVTGAVPEQVAAYQLVAEQVRKRIADPGPA
jgi:hypothetical protein